MCVAYRMRTRVLCRLHAYHVQHVCKSCQEHTVLIRSLLLLLPRLLLQIRTIAIIAEGVPESQTRAIIKAADAKGKYYTYTHIISTTAVMLLPAALSLVVCTTDGQLTAASTNVTCTMHELDCAVMHISI
jgi:hypothetical protein